MVKGTLKKDENSPNINIVSGEDIKKFFEEFKTKIVKSEREDFIQKNQWIILNMSSEQLVDYASIGAGLEEEERGMVECPEMELFDQYYEEAKVFGLDYQECVDYAMSKMRERKKIEEEKRLEKIKKIDTKEKEEAQKETKRITERTTIKDIWLKLVERKSYFNETPAVLLFHVLMGQVLKDMDFYKGNGEKFNLKCSMFMIQNSRSGKGKLVDVFCDVADNLKNANLKYAEFKGNESDAVLLSHFKYKKDVRKGYDFSEIIPGKLERYDFYIYREARPIIKPTKLTQNTSEYFLHILEGKSIMKELEKWDGHESETVGKGSLIATSRPIGQLNKFIVESGLMQRCLCYMRRLTNYERDKMREQVSLRSVSNKSEKICNEYGKEVQELANKIANISAWAKANEKKITIGNEEELNSLINRRTKELSIKIKNGLSDMTYIDIALSFVGGWLDYIDKLIYQNAIIRKSITIEMQDASLALDLIERLYEQLELWIQECITPDLRMRKEISDYTGFIGRLIETYEKNSMTVPIKLVISKLCSNRKYPISTSRAERIIIDLTESSNSPFIIRNEGNNNYIKKRRFSE